MRIKSKSSIIQNKPMLFKNSFSLQHKRLLIVNFNNRNIHLSCFYSTNVDTCTKDLYKDRLAPVKPFSDELLTTCSNILDLNERAEFFKDLKGKGGIYIFQYKFDPLVYYIGRTTSFSYRLKYHINHKLTDKFHVFGNLVGWDHFYVSVVEICNKEDSGVRENYYLQKYLPLLNSTFSSNLSDANIFESLTNKLKAKKFYNSDVSLNISSNKYKGIQIWGYKLLDTKISEELKKYSSINNASSATGIGIARSTISLYLDTNVPIKELLFFSKPLENLAKSFELANKLRDELNLDSNISKKVWVYTITEDNLVLVNGEPFNSRELVAKFLETTHKVVRYFMDSWEGKGYKGYYLFSRFLTDKELNSLLKICLSKPEPENTKV
uniref:GIY endonuclease n=2 Tax=Ceratocystis TaxID=5157 RepID=A0A5C1VB26_9PEZI|nr:GIY endonuclease [Ceratocystis fimbriata]YP_009710368.1 GIY endonuclease [Ceratocystis albifundus]QEN73779.1 GIY endonuclease [Ceratocystis fimbriata]QFX74870.1 GIY endonuclease [Ceratocystis albifundus]